ncbi:MAG: TonB-dependent receptor, partial [Gemmatimonadaceae bacterium]
GASGAPTVEELYSHGMHAAAGTYDVGNPDLRAETSVGAEAIVRVRGPRTSAQIATYVNRISDYVTPDIVGDTLVDAELVPLNRFSQADAQLSGAEGTVEVHLGRSLVASVMGDVVRGAFTAGGALPFMPPARLGAGLRWEDRGRFVSSEARHGFAQDRVTGGDVDVATDAYTVVNLSAGRQWIVGNVLHQVTLRADNVENVRYFDAASRIKRFAANPGRNITLVYQVRF